MARLWMPDSRFERPELFEPGRKPTGKVKVDFNKSIAKGLDYYIAFINSVPIDLIHNLHMTHVGIDFKRNNAIFA